MAKSLSDALTNFVADMRRGRRACQLPVLLLLLAIQLPAAAEVVRFEITSREPLAGGESFGERGPYERIVGKVHYAIDPKLARNGNVVDLKLAPTGDDGRVEFVGDLFILAPTDLKKGNGALLYDVNNRGNKLALRFFNDAPGGNDPKDPGDLGNRFLMRRGFTVVWSGWDGELLPGGGRLQLMTPVAAGDDGPITGPVCYEIVPRDDVTRTNVNRDGHGAYRPTLDGLRAARLTWRLRAGDRRVMVPRDQYRIHVTDVEPRRPGQLPRVELELPAGLKKGYIYELVYQARDPLVHGVCFTALGDLISAIKHGTGQDNPLSGGRKPVIERAYGFGVSQSGRFLREFLYWGFNEDERGRQVFDGLVPHVAGGGLGSFNHRFAQPTWFTTQHEQHDGPVDRFPFAYENQHDPLSKRNDGILNRSKKSKTAPWVLHTQSSAEYWSRSGSLVHTDPLGTRDARPPDCVRIYAFGGTQHGPSGYPPQPGIGQTKANPGDYRPFLRALLAALDRSVRDGTPALPPSVYPKIDDKTLVDWDRNSTGFPFIPGVRYPEVIQQPSLLDFGSRWSSRQIIDVQPPRVLGDYKVLVAKCDADGNPLGCLLPPEVAVPLATFTGWNLRNREAGAENELVRLAGSYIVLPLSRADGQSRGDPRQSLEERYGTIDQYLNRLKSRCEQLVQSDYLLEEDAQAIVHRQKNRAKPLFGKIAETGSNP